MRIFVLCRIICLPHRTLAILSAGGGGLRKLRWSAQGRGKRGGARVIYFRYVPGERIYLLYGYVKSEREDLTPQQVKQLGELMKDVKHG